MVRLPRWLIGDAVALDELGNAIMLDGNPHETISAHCGAQIEAGRACRFCRIVCRILGHFFPNHCRRAWNAEKAMIKDSAALEGVDSSNPGGQ